MADGSIIQADFSGGIFRGRTAPENAVYDAVNALVNDEAELFRRAGSTYLTTSDGAASQGVWAGRVGAGDRTLAWSNDMQIVNGAGWVDPPGASNGPFGQRVVSIAGYAIWAPGYLYAGSLKAADYGTGTVATTAGSRTLAGTGTSWTANLDPGMIFVGPSSQYGVVKTVTNDSSLELMDPWPTTGSGITANFDVMPLASLVVGDQAPAIVGVGGLRLLAAAGDKVYMTDPLVSSSATFGTLTDYHQLPAGATVLGIEGRGTGATVFTSAGIFFIENLILDILDDAGNVQHEVRHVNQDLILWHESGLAAWNGATVVPAIDDVWLLAQDASLKVVSEGIRPLYRQYVEAGYRPGYGTVHRGHYFLPIVTSAGGAIVDVLVCRLDRGAAWTRWDGHAAGMGFAGKTTGTPKLYGIKNLRVTDLTGCFDPDVARDDDADGTDHQFTTITRDLDLIAQGQRKPGHAEKAEIVYELDGTGATVAVSWAAGEEGSSFTIPTVIRGGVESDGSTTSVWPIGKSRRSIRLRIVQSGAAARMILRQVAVKVRQSGF